ncbi:MAG: SLC13 family permease [Myxococcota bacterium]
MGPEAWLTVGVTVGMVLVMALNVAGPDVVLLGGLTILLAAGVVSAEAAFDGFSNPAVLTIAALFVVAAGVRETGGLDFVGRRILGRPRSLTTGQLRMMLPVSGISAFLNNTPVVAMMVPLVTDWARRTGLSHSRLLMPLSYAAILGGVCTLIGTSTNLVVAGMALARDPGLRFGMFEIAWLGVPVLVVGTLYVLIASRWLLPDGGRSREMLANPREYTVLMRVEDESPIVGQAIEQAGLRHLPGLYLVEIERDGEVMPAVGPETRLHAQDRLLFAGIVDSVVDLRKIRGLVPATDQVEKLEGRPQRCLVEAVVAAQSPLVGISVRETRFRTTYNAAIIAVHRHGERIRSKVGDIVLRAGDVLLLETERWFLRKHRHDRNFALLSEVEGSEPPKHDKAWIATLILVAMVAVNTATLLPLEVAALIAAGVMILTRCLTAEQGRRALDLRVLVAVAAAFGIGGALDESGAAGAIGAALVDVAVPFGPLGVLVAVYFTTALMTEIISNNAAAALMFPIAAAAARASGMELRPILLVLMIAASASFSTPIGYQTNLMVFGPGGYRYADFLRVGLPLQMLIGVLTVLLASALWL